MHFPRPSSSAYLLFAGCVAAGSPALGEEGFAPAGFIFAAGVLAFTAAVPAVAFSRLGRPAPPPPAPPAPLHQHHRHQHHRRLAMMRLALPPGRALRQKSTSCSAYASLSLCRALARRQGLNARGEWVGGYQLLRRDKSARNQCRGTGRRIDANQRRRARSITTGIYPPRKRFTSGDLGPLGQHRSPPRSADSHTGRRPPL